MEKKRTGKKKITILVMSLVILILIILLLLCRCGAGTEEICSGCGRTDAHGVITTGNVRISLVEHTLVDGQLVPFGEDEPEIMPGETMSRIVTVVNHDKESFIRARVELVVYDQAGKVLGSAEDIMALDIDGTKWLSKDGDGWFYHHIPVGTEEATEELFTTVSFDAEAMDNRYQNCRIEMNVYAQAVQAANNGEDVLTAAGWPED